MPAELLETHTSMLLLVDDLVYKRKKPLDLGFSDFRSLEARRHACEEEVRLNRRLAPDVYDGVATLLDPEGEPCESLVVMRRLPAGRRLSALVAADDEVGPALLAIAAELAALHSRSPAQPEMLVHATAPALAQLWDDGCDVLAASAAVPGHLVARVRQLGSGWLEAHEPLLERRVQEHRMVDGHGDLLADDVFVLDDGPRILDCLEFDAGLRTVDGLHDACALAADLERLGAPDLGRRFLERYRSLANDTAAPRSLEHFYLGYRALVRAKVACLRAAQGDPRASAEALLLTALCRDHIEAAQCRLVLVGGLPGSGKSTVAQGLARTLGARHLSTDHLRRDREEQCRKYSREARGAVYQDVLVAARDALAQGEDVVLDATFSDQTWRAAARALGSGLHARTTELICRVPDAVGEERLRHRPAGESEATPRVRAVLAEHWDPWPEAVELPCTGTAASAVARAAGLLRT
jgi:aminoglycoside phosphotransferase family enzyme/predicted kinase